jgi:parallel beta-helix repeat protein
MDVNRNNTVILANGAADGNGYSDSVTIYRVEVNGRYCGHDVDPESSSDYLYNGVRILNAAFWNITDCEIHHVGDSTWSTGFGYPLTIIDCIGMQIEGNYLHHGGHDMMMLDGSCYCTIKNNLFMNYWGGGLYVYGGSHYNLIENNLIYHTGEAYGDGEAPDYPKAGVMICAPLNVLRRNIVYTPWNQGVHLQSYLAASTPDSGSCHNLVYNNTIYHSKWGYGNVILQSRLSSGMRTTDNVFANNIIYGAWGCGGGTACMSCPGDYLSPEILAYEGAGDIARNTFNNNLIRHRASVATYDSLYIFATVGCVNYSLAEIEAADPTYWHDNITNLPDFVSYNPDSGDTLLTGWWHLQEGSACIDSGVSVAVHDTIGLYVESLYPGYGWDTLAWYGTAPDIGAYEAQYYDTCCSTPADYNYGNVNAGGYQDNDFYIINCGDSTLHLDIGLSDSTEFTIQSGGGLDTLTGSQSCTVSVRFEPDDEGAEADTLTFGLDACDTVFLSGTGVTMNVADCSLSTAEVDFGNVEIDSIEYASFTIFNVGETPCDTLELNITETSDTFGIYLHGGVQHVVDGDSLTVGVYFHPEQFGIHACTLQTGSDSCSTVILGGVGIATPCCSESQSSFAFGSVYIDSSSVDTLFITNCDPDCTLTCNPDLADSTQYWITWVSEGWDEWTLDPSEICSLEVTFIPTSVGWKFDTLTWTQDSCDAVYISGRGVDTTDGLLGYQLQWWNKPHEYFLRMAP